MLKFYVKVFYVMGKALSGKLSWPCDRSCLALSLSTAARSFAVFSGSVLFMTMHTQSSTAFGKIWTYAVCRFNYFHFSCSRMGSFGLMINDVISL